MPTDQIICSMKVNDAEISNGWLAKANERRCCHWADCCKTVTPEVKGCSGENRSQFWQLFFAFLLHGEWPGCKKVGEHAPIRDPALMNAPKVYTIEATNLQQTFWKRPKTCFRNKNVWSLVKTPHQWRPQCKQHRHNKWSTGTHWRGYNLHKSHSSQCQPSGFWNNRVSCLAKFGKLLGKLLGRHQFNQLTPVGVTHGTKRTIFLQNSNLARVLAGDQKTVTRSKSPKTKYQKQITQNLWHIPTPPARSIGRSINVTHPFAWYLRQHSKIRLINQELHSKVWRSCLFGSKRLIALTNRNPSSSASWRKFDSCPLGEPPQLHL